jgi:hypothetical protein
MRQGGGEQERRGANTARAPLQRASLPAARAQRCGAPGAKPPHLRGREPPGHVVRHVAGEPHAQLARRGLGLERRVRRLGAALQLGLDAGRLAERAAVAGRLRRAAAEGEGCRDAAAFQTSGEGAAQRHPRAVCPSLLHVPPTWQNMRYNGTEAYDTPIMPSTTAPCQAGRRVEGGRRRLQSGPA